MAAAWQRAECQHPQGRRPAPPGTLPQGAQRAAPWTCNTRPPMPSTRLLNTRPGMWLSMLPCRRDTLDKLRRAWYNSKGGAEGAGGSAAACGHIACYRRGRDFCLLEKLDEFKRVVYFEKGEGHKIKVGAGHKTSWWRVTRPKRVRVELFCAVGLGFREGVPEKYKDS